MTTAAEGRRRVVVLSHLYPNAARPHMGPFVADQVEELSRRFEIHVISPTRWLPLRLPAWEAERRLPRAESRNGVLVVHPRVPALPWGGMTLESILWRQMLARRLRAAVGDDLGTILHAHFAIPDGDVGVRIGSELGIPTVVTLHGSDALVFPDQPSLARIFRRVVSSATRVIAVSDAIAERAIGFGADESIVRVIPAGTPIRPVAPAVARRDLGLPEGSRWLLWIGGLHAVKQPELAIDTFALVLRSHPDLNLAVAGDGPLRRLVEQRISAGNLDRRVRLLGHVERDTVARWVAAAELLLNTSRSEGNPVAVAEALVSGTPVVAPPVGGIAVTLARVQGGTLAAEGSVESLADAVARELGYVRDRAAIAAESSYLRVDVTGAAVADVYDELT